MEAPRRILNNPRKSVIVPNYLNEMHKQIRSAEARLIIGLTCKPRNRVVITYKLITPVLRWRAFGKNEISSVPCVKLTFVVNFNRFRPILVVYPVGRYNRARKLKYHLNKLTNATMAIIHMFKYGIESR